jgi:HD-GYP domain-containing protein (c-di-GMP phosphodiesterase class II)
MEQIYIPAKQANLTFYQAVPLYFQDKDRKFVLYKPAGNKLDNIRIDQGRCPEKLFIKKSDELKGIREVQNAFYQQLKSDLKTNSHVKVKNTLIEIVEETFSRPKSGSLDGLSIPVNILVNKCDKESNLARNLVFVPRSNYNIILHSVNVMALAIDFCFKEQFSIAETKILGLSALLHDVGKTKINPNVLKAANKLDDDEFEEFQTHTTIGYQLISKCKFSKPDVKMTALQHHERIDGGGYPNKLKRISKTAQIVGLIDCYESLTNNDRPYKSALDPLETLTILKNEIDAGRFDRKIFEKFAYSLM